MQRSGAAAPALAWCALCLWSTTFLQPVRAEDRKGGRTEQGRSAGRVTGAALPSLLLRVNREPEPQVFTGTPVVFAVRISNEAARDAVAQARSDGVRARFLREAAQRGEIAREAAEEIIAAFPARPGPTAVRLGDGKVPWQRFVRIVLRTAAGREEPLPWAVRLLAPPPSVLLAAEGEVLLDYALEPEAAARVRAGAYRLAAVLEVPPGEPLPPEHWRGRAESEELTLTVKALPEVKTPAEEAKLNQDAALFFAATGSLSEAASHARKSLAADPRSIHARMLLGEVLEAQGDGAAALAAFQGALAEFRRRFPDSYEAPLYLIERAARLQEKVERKR